VEGDLRACLLAPSCNQSFGIDLLRTSPSAGVGVGGTVTAYPQGTAMLSLRGAPWTLRTTALAFSTNAGGSFLTLAAGHVHGPASFTGSTALTGGELQLVTPVRISHSGTAPPLPSGFARLRVRFLPEPGWLLGVASGLAGLVLIARRRRG
jgi:hypothetical protein